MRMPERVVEIQALGPLFWRDGRPFSAADGTETTGRSLPLPYPSTLAGFVRTQIGRAEGAPFHDPEYLKVLHAIPVLGPLLVEDQEILLPAPRDAVVYWEGEKPKVVRLIPRPPEEGEGTDLPEGLWPLEVTEEAKPATGFNFWTAEEMTRWLLGEGVVPKRRVGPPEEVRVHVALDPSTGASRKGQLFSVAYRSLEGQGEKGRVVSWSLRARVTLPEGKTLAPVGVFGGEARPVAVEVKEGLSEHWFDCPEPIKARFQGLGQGARIRMVLATPAIFAHGWRPGWLERPGEPHQPRGLAKVRLRLVAAAVGRREAVSGWNLRTGRPKPVRWLVPAGSVYFFEVEEGDPRALLESWMRPVSDREQDRKDGFGLAIWGVW